MLLAMTFGWTAVVAAVCLLSFGAIAVRRVIRDRDRQAQDRTLPP